MSLAATLHANRESERRLSLDDVAARAIILICVLNLNGVLTMLTGVGQTFSWALLCAALFLVARHGSKALTSHALWFAILIGSYLAFGFLSYNPGRSFASPFGLAMTYVSSILIVLALVGYISGLRIGGEIDRYMSFVRSSFVVAALATLLSPALYALYSHVPLSGRERMGGLFGNPNEAAIVGVLSIVFLFTYPVRKMAIQLLLVTMCSVAVIITLSKTGISLLIIVGLAIAILRGRFWAVLLLCVTGALVILMQPDFKHMILASVDALGLDLTGPQLKRLLAIPEILGGNFDADTTTNRTYIWNLILSDALDRFPAGGGLGSAHFYFGGLYENNIWQGAHNTFLMLFAEAGPIQPLLLIYMLIAVAVRLWNAGPDYRGLLIAWAVLVVEMSGAHNALATRYSNVAMASLIGVAQALWVARRQGGAASYPRPGGTVMSLGRSRD